MAADNRSQGRSNVFLAATLRGPGGQIPARIRNISPRGALVEGPGIPPPGSKVTLLRGQLSASGDVTWSGNNHAGINFESEIDVPAWVARVGHAGQQRVDQMVAALRRSGSVPEALQVEERPQTLKEVSDALDRFCERLAIHPKIRVELGEELIRLDTIAEALRRLAARS